MERSPSSQFFRQVLWQDGLNCFSFSFRVATDAPVLVRCHFRYGAMSTPNQVRRCNTPSERKQERRHGPERADDPVSVQPFQAIIHARPIGSNSCWPESRWYVETCGLVGKREGGCAVQLPCCGVLVSAGLHVLCTRSGVCAVLRL